MRLIAAGCLVLSLVTSRVTARQVDSRQVHTLSGSNIKTLVESDPEPWPDVTSGHLSHLLIPRVAGTENNTLVREYISSVFKRLGWHEEQDSFVASTPIGDVPMTNLIYTFDPDAPRKLVVAAHHDSKYFDSYPANQFVGATDSAAPCAMMLDLAQAITPLLASRNGRMQAGAPLLSETLDEETAAETTLQFIFLDGEEAFIDWTSTDSVYGARHLAEKWESTYLPEHHSLSRRRYRPLPSVLDTIEHFVLLDLLGDEGASIPSYFRETEWLHTKMKSADVRLRDQALVQGKEWFKPKPLWSGTVGDDHEPFLHRGVNILHIISVPFPSVWHKLSDDASALHLPSLRRWNSILRVFTAEYLGLYPDTEEKREGYRIELP